MEYIAHHGVKGQKWGIRRYQNMDGTLTDEGRRRYGYGREASRIMTKNTASRLKSGARIGSKVGSVVGAVSGAASAAGIVALLGPGAGAVAMAGYTFTASTLSGTLGGTIYGGAAGGIVGAVETHKGRKYIERYDKGLKEFERLDMKR